MNDEQALEACRFVQESIAVLSQSPGLWAKAIDQTRKLRCDERDNIRLAACRDRANGHIDHIRGSWEIAAVPTQITVHSRLHDHRPDRRGAINTAGIDHRRVIRVANPNANGKIGSITDRPVIENRWLCPSWQLPGKAGSELNCIQTSERARPGLTKLKRSNMHVPGGSPDHQPEPDIRILHARCDRPLS